MKGKAYWRSLEELAETPEFQRWVESEFPSIAPELLAAPSRRRFLKLMGASLAMAGVTGCRWPVEKIAPYASRPANRIPGKPVRYATAMELGGAAAGLLVSSYDGRPIKVEGNPSHPINRGATDAFSQASVLELYDPDRSNAIVESQRGRTFYRTWDEYLQFAKERFGALQANGGAGLSVLSEASSSLSFADVRARFLKAFPQALWHEYEPLSRDNERIGSLLALGGAYRTHYALDRADVVVCLDADLLMTHPAAVKHARDFVAGREVDEHGRRRDSGRLMNRLYVAESTYSVTGAMADHRLAVTSAGVPRVACLLAAALLKHRVGLPKGTEKLRDELEKLSAPGGEEAEFIDAMARDLASKRGRGVIAAGPRQPAAVHALAHVMNAALGNAGTTISCTEEEDAGRPTHGQAIAALADDLEAGKVDTLLILGGNPVFDAPTDVDFGRRIGLAKTTIHLSLFSNETSAKCTWRVPRAHYLESWGDARAYDGTISIIQPLIEPLYGGKTPAEVLASVVGAGPTTGYDAVRETLRRLHSGADFESWWRRVLHDGVVPDSQWPTVPPQVRGSGWIGKLVELAKETPSAQDDTVEVVFTPDCHVYDGRFANNGWLQEMPDPMTKLTWDNAAVISPAMADRMRIEIGDVVKIESDGRSLEIAAFVLPGQADHSVTISLGHGRSAAGQVGDGTGFNAYGFRVSGAMDVLGGVRMSKTGRSYPLANTQHHHAIDTRVTREEQKNRLGMLFREADVEEFKKHPDFAKHAVHHPPLLSLWEERKYDEGRRWGMAIDLNKCIGCSACVVACQAENNVPVVGKEEVRRGREMQWIRVDRYFKGEPEDPQVAHQPVTCHQCENAPCEEVCPVAATMHSDEGLNDMVYNRCVGTRYCSNNCPYKVRRFNWFNNRRDLTETEKMVYNPEVTVRGRGVMEKCTYCVQRIVAVRIKAANEGRAIMDGEIVPACAQACPTRAIAFGDLNDAGSGVAKAQGDARAYAMLAELNVKPRTMYLAKLRNPAGKRERA